MEINSSEVSFEIGRASSGQSVSDTVSRKTPQNAANALNVVANSLQNAAKRRKTQQMHLRLSPIHRKMPQKILGCRQFTAKCRKKSNYIRDSESQDSNDQKSNHENGNENERRGLHGNMQGRGQWEWKSTVQF